MAQMALWDCQDTHKTISMAENQCRQNPVNSLGFSPENCFPEQYRSSVLDPAVSFSKLFVFIILVLVLWGVDQNERPEHQ